MASYLIAGFSYSRLICSLIDTVEEECQTMTDVIAMVHGWIRAGPAWPRPIWEISIPNRLRISQMQNICIQEA